MTKAKSLTARRITKMRRRIGAGFKIRGTTRKYSVSTKSSIPRDIMPAYLVRPLYRMHSKHWLSKLHATVHAAVARALQHGNYVSGVLNKGWDSKKISSKDLPLLVVFSDSHFTKEKSGIKAFLDERHETLAFSRAKFEVPFQHKRRDFEEGVVHGKIKPSFVESRLRGQIRKGKLYPGDKKLFQVALTKKEFENAVNRINNKLKKVGVPSIEELDKMDMETAWRKAREASGHERVDAAKPKETYIMTPSAYLFYNEACQLLTNKLVRRATKWIETNIPEK